MTMRNVPAFAWLLLLVTPVASAAPATGSRPENARKPASMIVESEKPGDETPPIPEGDERRAIGDTIRDNSGPVRECYEKRLQQRPTLQGKLVVRFDIGPAGKVIGATTEGIADRELSVCVLAAVRKLQFEKPRSGGKLRIAYPFKFEPKPAK